MRTVVIGDIHGCYDELYNLITGLQEDGKYNIETDRLIFLGDYIDRGNQSSKVIKYIRHLQSKSDNVIALMGNHEDMMVTHFELNGYDNGAWAMNGGNETKWSYASEEELMSDVEWAKKLPLYYEDEHFIYVHAGVNVNKDMNEQSRNDLLWIREGFIYNNNPYYKRVVFGHTPLCHKNPYYTPTNNICIDTACVFNGCLTALILDDGEIEDYYQVEKIN